MNCEMGIIISTWKMVGKITDNNGDQLVIILLCSLFLQHAKYHIVLFLTLWQNFEVDSKIVIFTDEKLKSSDVIFKITLLRNCRTRKGIFPVWLSRKRKRRKSLTTELSCCWLWLWVVFLKNVDCCLGSDLIGAQ